MVFMILALNRDGSSLKKVTAASSIFMGLGHILFLKQYVKGIFFALIEVAMLFALPTVIGNLTGLITLGAFQPDLPVRERDHSMFMMIDGIMTIAVVALFVLIYVVSVRSARSDYKRYATYGSFEPNSSVITNLGNRAFPVVGLMPLILLVLFFVIVPLVFSACVAFTNYSSPAHIPPNNTVDWVGVDNFKALFGGDATWTGALGRVAAWTVIWAVLATFTCYVGGLLMAVLVHETKMKISPVFRTIFILPYAVPSVVSMLVWRNLLNGSFGTVNRTLAELGLISMDAVIPWLSDATFAKFTCVLVNLWAGFPYFMLLTMGTMTAISADIYEAAKIDGANRFQVFRSITLPIVLYQTTPLIIMSFTHNINNFGAIFFLTGGNPMVADSTTTSARGTDILVTWIYKLTVDLQQYHYAAVIAICIFVILAPFAIANFRRTKSFKEGDM